MRRILVWDFPVRFFHWILAISFVIAFAIANFTSDHSPVFAIHMLLGGMMAFMVLLRLVWGFIGTKWARFSTFEVNPKELGAYIKGAFTSGEKSYTGHNPGSSLAAIIMFVLILGLATTGIMMSNGGGEAVEELHELLAWTMIFVVGIHLLGIAWFTVRNRENIAKSMIDGRKVGDPAGEIPTARVGYGVVFLLLVGLWTAGLINGYDATSGQLTVPLTGQTIQVGEGTEHGSH